MQADPGMLDNLAKRRAAFVSDHVHCGAFIGQRQRVILHPGAAAEIPHHYDRDPRLWRDQRNASNIELRQQVTSSLATDGGSRRRRRASSGTNSRPRIMARVARFDRACPNSAPQATRGVIEVQLRTSKRRMRPCTVATAWLRQESGSLRSKRTFWSTGQNSHCCYRDIL